MPKHQASANCSFCGRTFWGKTYSLAVKEMVAHENREHMGR